MARYRMTFAPASDPLAGLVTKFGGQPVWLERPAWPVSRSTGNRMMFIGQVALDPTLLGDGAAGRVAYLFMAEEEEYVDGTWEPEGGENAVVIQPSGGDPPVETREIPTGRTVPLIGANGAVTDQPSPSLAISLEPADGDAAASGRNYNLFGGEPDWLQGEELPPGDGWQFVLSLDSAAIPFWVNFGDAGVGYLFVSTDCTRGRFLWQGA